MDDALVPSTHWGSSSCFSVLILVVMDDALVQQNVVFWLFEGIVRQKSALKDFVLTNIMYFFLRVQNYKEVVNATNYLR